MSRIQLRIIVDIIILTKVQLSVEITADHALHMLPSTQLYDASKLIIEAK